jgi:hypothetical protein
MNYTYFWPSFKTEHLFLNDKEEVLYVIPWGKYQPYLSIPMDISPYIKIHTIMKSFCIFGRAFCYACEGWYKLDITIELEQSPAPLSINIKN